MIPRSILVTLVFALPLLVVAFAVLMGGYALAQAADDASGALGLWWAAMSCLILICVDVILLVGVLGVRALGAAERRRDESESP